MRARRKQNYLREEESGDDESNWLVSYADLMTLLWGFFVILSAFSTPDPAKMEELKKSAAESMGGKYESSYKELTDKLKKILENKFISKDAGIIEQLDGVKITFDSKYFFKSASANLKKEAIGQLTEIGAVLKVEAKDFKIIIEGHTDDLAIHTSRYPSNWELSLLRATQVVHLFEKIGIEHNSLIPMGLADTKPLIKIKNLKAKELFLARDKNRRIVIYIKKLIKKI